MNKAFCHFLILFILTSVCFISCSQKDINTTISWWAFPNFGSNGAFEQELIDAFEEKHPNITVELTMLSFENGYDRIQTAIATNIGPDMTYDAPGRIIAWGNEDLLVPLNDLIEDNKDHLAEGPLAASMSSDGNYYMYPVHSGGFMMAFNKNMLEDLGVLNLLPYKKGNRSWTLQEYETLLTALKEKLPKGKVPGVFYAKSTAGDQGTRAFMVNLNGAAPLMNNSLTEYTFNNTNAVKNARWVQDATSQGLLLNGYALDSNDAIDMYCASNAASTILFSLQLEKINADKIDYNGEYFESIYMPYPNSSENPTLEFIVGGPAVFDNGDKDKIKAAKLFIEFIANDPVYAPLVIEATGLFPVSQDITLDFSTEEQQWNSEAVDFFGSYYNTTPGFSEMRDLWYKSMQAILRREDAQTVLDEFVNSANQQR